MPNVANKMLVPINIYPIVLEQYYKSGGNNFNSRLAKLIILINKVQNKSSLLFLVLGGLNPILPFSPLLAISLKR